MHLLTLLLCILFHLANSTITIHIDGVYGAIVVSHIEGVPSARISYLVNDDETTDYTAAKDKMTFLGSVLSQNKFHIRFPLPKEPADVYLAILASPDSSDAPAFVNYRIPPESIQCNTKKLSFGHLADLQDSCVEVNVNVEGEGDVYLLGGLKRTAPLVNTIVNEGVYLGHHRQGTVKTVYCRFVQGEMQSLLATLVDGKCVHEPIRKDFIIPHFLNEYKWSRPAMVQWLERTRTAHQNIGIKFRRYSAGRILPAASVVVTVPPSVVHLPISPGGVLKSSTMEARKTFDELTPRNAELPVEMKPTSFSITWMDGYVHERRLSGWMFVQGEGNLYVLVTKPMDVVTAWDITRYGTNVGYFDEEAVDITVKDVEPGPHTIHAALVYGEECFGPFSTTI